MAVIPSNIPGIRVTELSICFLKVPPKLKSISICIQDRIDEKEENYSKEIFLQSKRVILMLKSKNLFFDLKSDFKTFRIFSIEKSMNYVH